MDDPRTPDDDPGPSDVVPGGPSDEPEPGWADAIRRRRKERADRLRALFDAFADEDADVPVREDDA